MVVGVVDSDGCVLGVGEMANEDGGRSMQPSLPIEIPEKSGQQ